MADQGRGSKVISAPVDQLWQVAVEVDRYPDWAGDVKSVTVDERDEAGRPARATFTVGSFGLSSTYTVEYEYDEPRSFRWHLVQSHEMRRLDGEYRFDDRGDGTVEVTYTLTVDLKIPVIGMIKRKAEKTIISHALDGLRKEAERRNR